MAVGASLLTSGGASSAATSFATASITPAANDVVLLWIGSASASAGQGQAPTTAPSGNGITFTKLVENSPDGSGCWFSLWYGKAASPTTGTISWSYTNSQGIVNWVVMQLTGAKNSGTNGVDAFGGTAVSATGTSSANSAVTLGAFSSGSNGAVSAHYGVIVSGSIPTATPDTGWTEVADTGNTSGGISQAVEVQIRDTNDTSAAATWSASQAAWGALAVEIAAVVVGGSTIARQMMQYCGG